MEPELKQKIEKYVANKYSVEQQRIRAEYEEKMRSLPQRGKGNGAYSVYADDRHIKLHIEMVNSWARAMGDIRMQAYEIYGAPLDDQIVAEVKIIRDGAVGAVSGTVAFQMQLEAMRGVRDSEHGKAIATGFKRQLIVGTHYVDREISCLLEERKAVAKNENHSVGSITMNAPGQRVVIGVDQSQNWLTVSERTFFTQVDQIVRAQAPPELQPELLERLAALEATANKPDFAQRWTEFRSAAADYWSFILPCLPMIQDFLHRHGIT